MLIDSPSYKLSSCFLIKALNLHRRISSFIYPAMLVRLTRGSHYPVSCSIPQCNSVYIVTADFHLFRVA